ncbi:hypothetical protein NIES4071_18610 [Calothrix sp. NIES-4071]|nr:hypothetical protein NIES4071_18610 [Calothrix sp. NIES-4071]BAZ56194.1 hypothetical protein NIES4105_18560 [Calothrix sp. NIES-4105]
MRFYTLPGVLADLENFSLEELLEVKRKVDKLVASSVQQANEQSDMQALDAMIGLVEEWLQDDSGYDESVYPHIKAGLVQD